MNIKTLLLGATALTLAGSAFADTTINITGATAFRQACLNSIKARYDASGAPYKYAHDQAAGGTNYNGATLSVWTGSFPGVTGITTIRTSFNGSVEGVRALVNSPAEDPQYLLPALLNGTTAIVGGAELANSGTFPKATAQSQFAFSDVNKASTPYAAFSLQPASPAAGVVVFTMIGSKGTPLTNITSQQFRALMSSGFLPLSVFTGTAADNPFDASPSGNAQWIFATGRNDGSGTRTTYLAETGYGITKLVNQYTTLTSTGTTLTTIQLVPAGGVSDSDPITPGVQIGAGQSAANASTVWGQDVAGNGGYSSGSTLRTDMAKTGGSVTVYDDTYSDVFGAPQKLSLVTWLSLSDAVSARNGGAVFLGYNGVKLDGIAAGGSSMTAADLAKVTEGAYTAWGYENFYRRNDITTGDAVTIYNAIRNNLVLGSAGVPTASMKVSRAVDGGVVAP